jgi:hypothetical protein
LRIIHQVRRSRRIRSKSSSIRSKNFLPCLLALYRLRRCLQLQQSFFNFFNFFSRFTFSEIYLELFSTQFSEQVLKIFFLKSSKSDLNRRYCKFNLLFRLPWFQPKNDSVRLSSIVKTLLTFFLTYKVVLSFQQLTQLQRWLFSPR